MQTKTLSLPKVKIVALAQFAILLAVAVLAPALVHSQPITGPLVNALLFLSVALLGLQAGVLLALIPSVIALSVGLLPSALAPAVPFIMLGNILLVFVFHFFYKKITNYDGRQNLLFCLAVGSAAIVKFLFLYSASFVVVNLIAKQPIAQRAAQMLSFPQLLTALAGGLIAFLVLKAIKK